MDVLLVVTCTPHACHIFHTPLALCQQLNANFRARPLGDEVSVYYDPMISKLVVHAENRPAALRMMVFALSRYQIGGIKNNIEFVSAICKHPAFVEGSVTTHFIDVCEHASRCGDIYILSLCCVWGLHQVA